MVRLEDMQEIFINGKWISIEEYKKAMGIIESDWPKIFDAIDEAVEYFSLQDVKPTLRTLFYYLYSKGLIPNTVSSYTNLSHRLVEARKSGRYKWDFLEDTTRVTLGKLNDNRFSEEYTVVGFKKTLEEKVKKLDIEDLIRSRLENYMPSFYVERWADQSIVCEFWIEKQALASTLESWLEYYGVPIRVNRGYSSWTYIYNNVESLKQTLKRHDEIIIFYLGDLDPSGVDIERFLKEALEYFGIKGTELEFKRLALTSQQVEKFNLPPRPEDEQTKEKLARDPRYKKYNNEYIVELDALVAYAPSEFKRLIEDAVSNIWNQEIYEELEERAEEYRREAWQVLEDMVRKAKEKIVNYNCKVDVDTEIEKVPPDTGDNRGTVGNVEIEIEEENLEEWDKYLE